MMMLRRALAGGILGACGLVALAAAQTAGTGGAAGGGTPPPPVLSFSKANIAVVVAAFKSNNPAAMDARLPTINAWLAADHVPAELWKDCLPSLVAQGRNAEMADIALRGILGRPDGRAYHYLLPMRIEALIALGRAEEALEAAKSYYNVADEHHLSNAMKFVAMAFHRAHPENPDELWNKFQAQQNTPTPPADPVMKGITIDPSLYAGAIAHWKTRADAGKFADKVAYANLLLMADRPAEAEPLFRALLKDATTKADVAIVRDCVAASLRAEDQNVTRAHAFLAQEQAANVDLPAEKDKDLP